MSIFFLVGASTAASLLELLSALVAGRWRVAPRTHTCVPPGCGLHAEGLVLVWTARTAAREDGSGLRG